MVLISRSELEHLAGERDKISVSIFMPTRRRGAEIQENPIRLRNLLAEAEERLSLEGLRGAGIRELVEPAQKLLEMDEFWQNQSDGLALFLSPAEFRFFRLPLDFEELVIVGNRFHVKPLLPLLSGDGRFYVLALSQNEIRLLQASRYNVAHVELENVPKSLEEALKWDDPEKQLQWHTDTSHRVTGERPAVFHGHGYATADDPDDNILRYFQMIDEGLQEILAGEQAPLVLAGVQYLHPIYKKANSYPNLIDNGVHGNPEELSSEELHQQAWEVVEPLFQGEREQARDRYEMLAGKQPELVSSEVEKIVPAAYFARVEVLFIGLEDHLWGNFNAEENRVELHEEARPGDEDLLDFAAVHTLQNGGTVYTVDPQDVPGEGSAAAIFRYAG